MNLLQLLSILPILCQLKEIQSQEFPILPNNPPKDNTSNKQNNLVVETPKPAWSNNNVLTLKVNDDSDKVDKDVARSTNTNNTFNSTGPSQSKYFEDNNGDFGVPLELEIDEEYLARLFRAACLANCYSSVRAIFNNL